MSAFTEACRAPFSNGTEGDAWMSSWCSHCANDHGMHDGSDDPTCQIIGFAMFGEWPGEAWLPEPDDGRFALPSRLCCLAFKPCVPCGGDPGESDRAQRIEEVTAYWSARPKAIRRLDTSASEADQWADR